MDGISAAASVIALVQVTSKVISICWKYKGLKSASSDAKRLINQLEGLKSLLVKIDELLEDEPSHSLRHKTLAEWTSSGRLEEFYNSLQHLDQKLQPSEGIRAFKNAVMFPLQQQDLEKVLAEIEHMKSTLNLALTVDQTNQIGVIETGVADLRLGQETEEIRRRLEAIQKWLAAPDITTNQAYKQGERQGESGRWFLRLDIFTQWLIRNNSLFWIHGIPGSGKSVLCSTVIHHVLENSTEKIDKIAIYFYFDVSEESKRSTENMIRALISQLAHRKMNNPTLNETYEACQDKRRTVTREQLLSILMDMLADFVDVVIIIDAIDEAIDANAVLQVVSQIRQRRLDHVHILVTSRSTPGIEKRMKNDQDFMIELSRDNVERDISAYVHERVNQSQRWPEPDRIRLGQSIVWRAQGLFRLASCLIDLVAECRTPRALNELLEKLPSDLNTVYERILLRIPRNERDSTKRMLEWLAFSGRPLRIGELTHAIAVNHPALQGFSHLDLDIAPFDSPLLCSSLVIKAQASILDVQSAPAYYSSAIDFATEFEFEEVRLAHASVREFLLEEALKNSTASDFHLDAQIAHRNIAETCLLYLLNPAMRFGVASQTRHQQLLKDWPLLLYAAHFWPDHANAANDNFREETWQLITTLFKTRYSPLAGNYGTWALTLTPEISLSDVQATTPLYYASSFGLAKVIVRLLDGGAREHINQLGGRHQSTALEVAAYRGRFEAVKLLLEAGADPNATLQGGYASTLSWPILRNHGAVAIYLIEHGATMLPGEWDDLRQFGWSDLAEYCLRLWERREGDLKDGKISCVSADDRQAVSGAASSI